MMKVVLRANVEASKLKVGRLEEMSPAMQKIYRETVDRFSAEPGARPEEAAKIIPKLSTRVIINGQEFASAGEMPPDYRRFYEEILKNVVPMERAIYTVARTEHVNCITRIVCLASVVVGCAVTIVYLWLRGYYG